LRISKNPFFIAFKPSQNRIYKKHTVLDIHINGIRNEEKAAAKSPLAAASGFENPDV
jgi:hypothetical protein